MKYVANSKKAIGMLAGGSGITPMIQIIKTIVNNPDDNTQISLVYANSTEEDILLHKELDEIAQKHSNFKVYYVVSKPGMNWSGYKGRINSEIISETMPKPDPTHLIYISGPSSFMESISGNKTPDKKQGLTTGYLKDGGYTGNNYYISACSTIENFIIFIIEEMTWKF